MAARSWNCDARVKTTLPDSKNGRKWQVFVWPALKVRLPRRRAPQNESGLNSTSFAAYEGYGAVIKENLWQYHACVATTNERIGVQPLQSKTLIESRNSRRTASAIKLPSLLMAGTKQVDCAGVPFHERSHTCLLKSSPSRNNLGYRM